MASYYSLVEKKSSYRVDDELLLDLHKEIVSFLEAEATCTISLRDQHTISSNNPTELLADPLVKSKLVQDISISAHTVVSGTFRRIDLSVSLNRLNTVSLTISGETDRCVAFRAKIEQLLSSRREWYSRFRYSHFSWVSTLYFISSFVLFYYLASRYLPLLEPKVLEERYADAAVTLKTIIAAALSVLSAYAVRFLFPLVVFDFGRSKIVAQYTRQIRSIVLVVIGIGILVNLSSSYIFNSMTGK